MEKEIELFRPQKETILNYVIKQWSEYLKHFPEDI